MVRVTCSEGGGRGRGWESPQEPESRQEGVCLVSCVLLGATVVAVVMVMGRWAQREFMSL